MWGPGQRHWLITFASAGFMSLAHPAAALSDRLIAIHRGCVYLDARGSEKRKLIESHLLGIFTRMRRDDRFDDAALRDGCWSISISARALRFSIMGTKEITHAF